MIHPPMHLPCEAPAVPTTWVKLMEQIGATWGDYPDATGDPNPVEGSGVSSGGVWGRTNPYRFAGCERSVWVVASCSKYWPRYAFFSFAIAAAVLAAAACGEFNYRRFLNPACGALRLWFSHPKKIEKTVAAKQSPFEVSSCAQVGSLTCFHCLVRWFTRPTPVR